MVPQKGFHFFRQNYQATILLVLLLAGSFLLFLGTMQKAQEQRDQVFRFRAQQAATTIERRMGSYIQVLLAARGLVEATDTITRQDWQEFIGSQNIEKNFPGIQGTGYVQLLKGSELESHQRQTRLQDLSDYTVIPPGERDLHAIITILEPMDERNKRALGYDMWTSPERRRALARARDTNSPALSERVTLVQETENEVQPGFLIFLPIYKGKAYPTTLTEKQQLAEGFVYIPFRAYDLFNAILRSDYPELEIAVFDQNSQKTKALLFSNTAAVGQPHFSTSATKLRLPLILAGNRWTLSFSPSPLFFHTNQIWWPYLLLLVSLIISFLVFFITWSLTVTRRSNQLKQIITDNATGGLFMMNAQGYCTFMNPAAERMTGFTFQEIQQKPLHQMIHHHYPDGRPYPMHECPIDRALPTHNHTRAHEDVFFRKDGSSFEVSVAASPIYDNGVPVATVVEVRDVTELKEAERSIQQNTERLQQVFYHVPAIVALVSATDMVYVLVNPQFMQLFGGRPMLGGTFSEAHPELIEQGLGTEMLEVVRSGKTFVANEYKLAIDRQNNGKLIEGYFNFVFEPVPDRKGNIDSVLIFGVEVTELVKGRQELSQANEELKRINTDLDNFVYSASHDLKSPITNIEGLTHELHESLSGKLTSEDEKLLELMEKSAKKLRKTVEELTEITKAQKQIQESEEPLYFKDVLADVLADIAPQIALANAFIETNFEVEQIRYAYKNLRSIVYNLVSNAVRYHSPDRQPHICITSSMQEGQPVLAVQDNGLGIRKEQHQKLFGMFTRLHQHVDGSGIGLYIVKRIIENNGGRIEVESEPDVGSTFRVWF